MAADGEQVQADVGVYGFCDGSHGDGPLAVGEPAVVLPATGEVVVEVRSPFVVTLTWPGEPFVAQGDGRYVSSGAAPGCHRLNVEVTDPANGVAGSFGVDVAMRSTC